MTKMMLPGQKKQKSEHEEHEEHEPTLTYDLPLRGW